MNGEDEGLPTFVMTDPDDLNWPRSMNPEDPEREGWPLNGHADSDYPMLFPIDDDRANDLVRRYRVKLNWVDIGWTVATNGDMGISWPASVPLEVREGRRAGSVPRGWSG